MGMFDWDSGSGNSLVTYRKFRREKKTLDDYALAYVGVGMVEIVIVSFASELMMTGQHWLTTLVTVVAGSAILLFLNGEVCG